MRPQRIADPPRSISVAGESEENRMTAITDNGPFLCVEEVTSLFKISRTKAYKEASSTSRPPARPASRPFASAARMGSGPGHEALPICEASSEPVLWHVHLAAPHRQDAAEQRRRLVDIACERRLEACLRSCRLGRDRVRHSRVSQPIEAMEGPSHSQARLRCCQQLAGPLDAALGVGGTDVDALVARLSLAIQRPPEGGRQLDVDLAQEISCGRGCRRSIAHRARDR